MGAAAPCRSWSNSGGPSWAIVDGGGWEGGGEVRGEVEVVVLRILATQSAAAPPHIRSHTGPIHAEQAAPQFHGVDLQTVKVIVNQQPHPPHSPTS
jgi:hypothetical protein